MPNTVELEIARLDGEIQRLARELDKLKREVGMSPRRTRAFGVPTPPPPEPSTNPPTTAPAPSDYEVARFPSSAPSTPPPSAVPPTPPETPFAREDRGAGGFPESREAGRENDDIAFNATMPGLVIEHPRPFQIETPTARPPRRRPMEAAPETRPDPTRTAQAAAQASEPFAEVEPPRGSERSPKAKGAHPQTTTQPSAEQSPAPPPARRPAPLPREDDAGTYRFVEGPRPRKK